MEAWLIIGPFILMIAWLIQTTALYPKNEYFFGRHTGDNFRYTSAGARLITRFRLILALGTALTILYFAGTLTGKSTLWDLLGFLPLFLAPAVAYTWNWWTAKRYQIQGSDEVTLGPTVPELMPRHFWPLLVLAAALPLASSYIPIYFGVNHRPSDLYIPLMTTYWTLKHCVRAYALARHSRQFQTRLQEIRRFMRGAWTASLLAGTFMMADAVVPFRQNPFPYLLGAGMFALLTKLFDRWIPPVAVPQETTPSDCWKSGYLYFNPRDPAWIAPRPNASSYAANFAHPSAWLLFVPEVLTITLYWIALKQ